MWSLAPLLPALMYGGGAILCLRAGASPDAAVDAQAATRVRWASVLAVIALLPAAAVLAVILGAGGPLHLSLPGWSQPPFPAPPAIDVDLASATCLMVLAAVASAAAAAAPRTPTGSQDLGRALGVAAASGLFIATARSALGLVLTWAVLDLTLYHLAGGGRRTLLVGHIGLLFAWVGLASLPPATSGITGATPAEAAPAATWLVAAAAIRMGLFPVWWALPPTRTRWAAAAIRLAPAIAGASLVLQLGAVTGPGMANRAIPVAIALAGAVFAGLLAGIRRRFLRRLDWAAVHHVALVLLAVFLGRNVGTAVAAVLLIDFTLTRAGLYLIGGAGSDRRAGWVRAGLNAAMLSLPPTLGFAARWLLYREMLGQGMTVEVGLVAAGTAFALAGPMRIRDLVDEPPESPRRGALIAASVLVGLSWGLGLGFDLLSNFLGVLARAPLSNPLVDVVAVLSSEVTRPSGIIQIVAVVGPVLAAWPLARLIDRASGVWAETADRGKVVTEAVTEADGEAVTEADGVAEAESTRPDVLEATAPRTDSGPRRAPARAPGLGRAAELTGLAWLVASTVVRAGSGLHRASGLVEGRRAMAWTLLATLALALLPFERQTAPPPVPAVPELAALMAITVIGATALMTSTPLVSLTALSAAYVTTAALLVFAGGPWFLAAIKLISGSMVIVILTIGVAQTPASEGLAGAARRLREMRPSVPGRSIVAGLAFAAAVVAIYGIGSHTFADRLSQLVLRPALGLAAGGLLLAVFARTPLRLSVGVFMALAAFELVYARLDPGILVTAGLAAFQLLLAIVASYFVGIGQAAQTGRSLPDARRSPELRG